MDKLSSYTKMWKELPRNNAEEICAADSFYNEKIMPISTARFLEQYGKPEKHYALMFVTVGTSWQPVALSILAKQPAKVVFLYTEGVKKEVDTALAFIEKLFKVPEYDLRLIDKASSELLIRTVREYEREYAAGEACFDITGGTKAMAAAAAMVAASLSMDIFYVESNYLPVYRHPEPGSEVMVKLLRPQDI